MDCLSCPSTDRLAQTMVLCRQCPSWKKAQIALPASRIPPITIPSCQEKRAVVAALQAMIRLDEALQRIASTPGAQRASGSATDAKLAAAAAAAVDGSNKSGSRRGAKSRGKGLKLVTRCGAADLCGWGAGRAACSVFQRATLSIGGELLGQPDAAHALCSGCGSRCRHGAAAAG